MKTAAKTINYYGDLMRERRDKFNKIINNIDAVLCNNLPQVDDSIWDNWEEKDPMGNDECEQSDNGKSCIVHDKPWKEDWNSCEDYEQADEVYQWFLISSGDADFLKRHNQYITYSDKLDTYVWAICHFGTSWDYVDSMVTDILGDAEEMKGAKFTYG